MLMALVTDRRHRARPRGAGHGIGTGGALRIHAGRTRAREARHCCALYESAFAERDKEESADLAAEFIRNFTQQEPIPGITYEYGMVQRFVPEITLDEVNEVAKDWAGGSRVVLVNAPQKPGLTRARRARRWPRSSRARRSGDDHAVRGRGAASQPLLERPPQARRRS